MFNYKNIPPESFPRFSLSQKTFSLKLVSTRNGGVENVAASSTASNRSITKAVKRVSVATVNFGTFADLVVDAIARRRSAIRI